MTDICENGLRKSNMTDDYIKNAKKNLRRKIERSILNVNFINVRRKLYIHPDLIEKTDIIVMCLHIKFEVDNITSISNSEKDIDTALLHYCYTALMMRENKNTKRYHALASSRT